MNIKITSKNGITLKTKGKYCNDDIVVTADESLFGVDTSDATATADDILLGKTVYARDEKLEGTIETYSGEMEVGIISTLKQLLDITKTTSLLFHYKKTETSWNVFFDYNDTENVTNMSSMFNQNNSLIEIPKMNTSNVTNMSSMFSDCYKLQTIPELNTSNVTDMYAMFNNCKSLTSIPQLDTSNVTNMAYMFYECGALTKIDLTYFNFSSTDSTSSMFHNCGYLKALIIRDFGNIIINSNAFSGTPMSGIQMGYIYVPRAMVDTLKSAAVWSDYASHIRALEDYTVDGTTTGELDERAYV